MPISVVILAAGQGKRMKSDLPKVLQPVAGRPLLQHVIDSARELSASDIHVVYGHGGERVREALAAENVTWALQAEQLGTGHAVQQAMPAVPDDHLVLILFGDVPLVQAATMQRLVEAAAGGEALGVLSVRMQDPTGYGRIVRDRAGTVARIVEHKDANQKERAIDEVNTGLMAASAKRMREWLAQLRNDNAQGEYYLTDVVVMAAKAGLKVNAILADSEDEVLGVNDKVQLAEVEADVPQAPRDRTHAAGRDAGRSRPLRCARSGHRRPRRAHRRQRRARRQGEAGQPRAHRAERRDPRQRDRRRRRGVSQLRLDQASIGAQLQSSARSRVSGRVPACCTRTCMSEISSR